MGYTVTHLGGGRFKLQNMMNEHNQLSGLGPNQVSPCCSNMSESGQDYP